MIIAMFLPPAQHRRRLVTERKGAKKEKEQKRKGAKREAGAQRGSDDDVSLHFQQGSAGILHEQDTIQQKYSNIEAVIRRMVVDRHYFYSQN